MPKNTDKEKQNIYIEHLVRQAQLGKEDSFGEIYDIFLPSIYRYVYFRVHEAYSEDITENIFLKAWEKIRQYSPRENCTFSSWIFRVAHNTIADHYRARKEFDEIPEYFPDKTLLGDPQRTANSSIELQRLKKAIDTLPENYQQVMILKYINDLDNKEIAHALGKTEGSVRVLQFRALARLRTILQKKKLRKKIE